MVVVVGAAAALAYNIQQGNGTKYDIFETKKMSLARTVEATGSLSPETEVDLTFQKSGMVEKIMADTGDSVKAGDVLAQLENGTQTATLSQAKASLVEAQAALNLELAKKTNEDIAMANADVDQAKADYDKTSVDYDSAKVTLANTKSSVDQGIKLAEVDLSDAENNLAKAQVNIGTSTSQSSSLVLNAIMNFKSSFGALMLAAKSSIQTIDRVFGVENESVFVNTTNIISTGTSDYVQARDLLIKNMKEYGVLDAEYTAFAQDVTADRLLAMDAEISGFIQDMNQNVMLTSRILESVITGVSFSSDKLTLLKGDISAAGSSFSGNALAYASAKKILQDAVINAGGVSGTTPLDLKNAEIALEKSQQNLEKTKVDGDIQISNAQNQVNGTRAQLDVQRALLNKATAALDLVLASPRAVDTAPYRARVNQAQAQVKIVQNDLDYTLLKSPLDGVVTLRGIEVGEQVTLGAAAGDKTAFKVIDKSKFHVDVAVPETQIDKIDKDSVVKMTFDALDPDQVFDGEIVSIEPASTTIDGIVYYKVKVMLVKASDRLKAGMTVDVTISAAPKENVIAIPEIAVRTKEGEKYVRIFNDQGKIEEVNVRTGLRGDNGMIEIVRGLNEGQKVITNQY